MVIEDLNSQSAFVVAAHVHVAITDRTVIPAPGSIHYAGRITPVGDGHLGNRLATQTYGDVSLRSVCFGESFGGERPNRCLTRRPATTQHQTRAARGAGRWQCKPRECAGTG